MTATPPSNTHRPTPVPEPSVPTGEPCDGGGAAEEPGALGNGWGAGSAEAGSADTGVDVAQLRL